MNLKQHCNKDMIKLSDYPEYFNNNILEDVLFICSECGTFYREQTYILDDEEYDSILENYKEELKHTKFYKDSFNEVDK